MGSSPRRTRGATVPRARGHRAALRTCCAARPSAPGGSDAGGRAVQLKSGNGLKHL